MREAVLLVVVASLCIIGLFRPFIALLSYLWFALMRPDLLAFAYGAQPISLIMSVVLVVSSLRLWYRFAAPFLNPIGWCFLAMQAAILLSVFLAVDRSLSMAPYLEYLRIILIPLFIPILVQSTRELTQVLLVMALSLGAVGTKFGLWGLDGGGAVFSAGYGGMLSDNNDMALAFVMTVSLCWYSRHLVQSKWLKVVLFVVSFATASAVVMTHSRGAALSMAAALCLVLVRSKRKLPSLILILLLLAPAVYLVRDSYARRLSTLDSYEQDRSAMDRVENAKAAFAMWKDHPAFGVGFGMNNFVHLSEKYGGEPGLVVHNTYLQTLVDDGIFAAALYVGLLLGTIIWLGFSARRMRLIDDHLATYPVSLQTALLAFAVGSTFLSRFHFDFFYMLLMCASAWYGIEKGVLRSASADITTEAALSLIPA